MTEYHERTDKLMGDSELVAREVFGTTPGSRRTALARVLRPFGLQPLQLGDHVSYPLNRDPNAFVILRQLVQLGQVTGPIHDAGVWAGLVGDHYMAHDIAIVPHRWPDDVLKVQVYVDNIAMKIELLGIYRPNQPSRRKRLGE